MKAKDFSEKVFAIEDARKRLILNMTPKIAYHVHLQTALDAGHR